jgi:beta-lactamase class A
MNIQSPLKELDTSGGQYAFYYRPHGGEALLRSNGDRFSAASVIKVPILLAWVFLERNGQIDKEALCNLDSEPEVHGAGFSWLMHQRQIPWHDVLLMMISLSDNLCTNLVIEHIGLERLQHTIGHDLGLQNTTVERKLMDFAAREQGRDNWISAQDCVRFYELLRQLSPQERSWVKPLLGVCQDHTKLMRDVPFDSTDFYHKSGFIPEVVHDWGYTDKCDIFLLTQGYKDEPRLLDIFGQLGRLMETGETVEM